MSQLSLESKLKSYRVAYLYQHSALLMWGHVVMAIATLFALWPVQTHTGLLLSWFTTIVFSGLIHWAVVLLYRHAAPRADEADRWRQRLMFILWLPIVLWAGLSIFVLSDFTISHHVMIALLITALATSGLVLLGAERNVYLAMLLGLLAPVMIMLVRSASQLEYILGLALLAIAMLMWHMSLRFYQTLTDKFFTQIELDQVKFQDSLTHLANRQQFEQYMETEWKRGLRTKKSLALLLIDIDHFRLYNNYYGRQAGDQCLVRIANVLQEGLARPADFVGYLGNGQFVVMLPETSWQGTLTIAENLSKAVLMLRIAHTCSEVATHLTVTIGVASMVPTADKVAKTLIVAADEGLYEGKRNGRNQVAWKNKHQVISKVAS